MTQAMDALLKTASDVGASSVADTVRPALEQLSRSQTSGLALAIGLAGSGRSSSR